ncbi:hypothetical protein BHE74_00014094 [Ensete ventricosum]|nr:hypothetical protein GW17_00029757 [Ensete ventricosum]RWW77716.1 hypothetical protein BHE74_00014094 [Ensete ventricosum]RZR90485.1 hypothetical protein BHM03_00018376 [Ensete ventricosum]
MLSGHGRFWPVYASLPESVLTGRRWCLVGRRDLRVQLELGIGVCGSCQIGASVLPRSTAYILGEFGRPCFHVVVDATTIRAQSATSPLSCRVGTSLVSMHTPVESGSRFPEKVRAIIAVSSDGQRGLVGDR